MLANNKKLSNKRVKFERAKSGEVQFSADYTPSVPAVEDKPITDSFA